VQGNVIEFYDKVKGQLDAKNGVVFTKERFFAEDGKTLRIGRADEKLIGQLAAFMAMVFIFRFILLSIFQKKKNLLL
jgi:hypothetical protein